MAFLNENELQQIGFKSIGKNVLISDKASIYGSKNITIGSNVRVDDFCIISATGINTNITIGNYIHIGCYSSIIGKGDCFIDDFCNISSKVAIYTSNDDYSGEYLTNPMVNEKYTNVTHGNVHFEKHVIIGSGSIILPNVNLKQGSAIGALSLIINDCEAFSIYGGAPAKKIKKRKTDLLIKEAVFLKSQEHEK